MLLDGKAKDVQLAESALAARTDIEKQVEGHREQIGMSLATQNEERIVEREQAIVAQMNEQTQSALGQVVTAIQSLAPMLQQIAALNAATVAELQKPKVASIGGVQMDASGRIVGATVSTTPVTVQ